MFMTANVEGSALRMAMHGIRGQGPFPRRISQCLNFV